METRRVRLLSDGLELSGELHMPTGHSQHPALCICHGIPAAPPDPTDRGYPLLAEQFCQAGFLTFIFNFRGTGKSQGNLDLLGWTRDLDVALSFLYNLKETDRTRLCLLGFSGGAAVSVYTAAHDRRPSSVVACACPAEFRSLTEGESPLSRIQRFRDIGAIRDRDFPPSREEWQKGFDVVAPVGCIDKVSPRPILLVHGEDDEVVPLSHARQLYDRAGDPKELRIVPAAGHRLRVEESAMDLVLEWLRTRCGIN